jgi:hypothetical protein
MASCEIDVRKITALNYQTLAKAKDGEKIPYWAWIKIVALGYPHHKDVMELVPLAGDQANAGYLTVKRTKPGEHQQGTMTVQSFRNNAVQRKNFEEQIKLFTSMKVVYV